MGQYMSQESSTSASDSESNVESMVLGQDAPDLNTMIESELDDFASFGHIEQIVSIDGTPSINFGLQDIFSYEHWEIPDLNGRTVWCFKVILESSGQAQVVLRETTDLSNITALSYTWGEGLREEAIGRYTGEGEGDCKLMLGLEWSKPDLISVLAHLSNNSWLWMDQIAKRPGMSKKYVISTFSTIYNHCSVVVLLPGPDCKYVHDIQAHCLNAGVLDYERAKGYLSLFLKHLTECGWYIPKFRWYNRVWTRQEALYSRRIRIVHVRGISECIPLSLEQQNPGHMLMKFRDVGVNCAEVFGTKMNSPDAITRTTPILLSKGIIAQVAFLLGLQVAYANRSPPLARALNRLAETNRKTTYPKDLILSVWPGVDFSDPVESWSTAYADISRYYQIHYHCTLPQELVQGATNRTTLNTLAETSLGQIAGKKPSVRSFYSRFQYLQVGALITAEGTVSLQVADEKVTVRPFPTLDNPCTAIRAIARYTEKLPVWVIRGWWRNILNAVDDTDSECLLECGTEAALLLLVLSNRLYSPQSAGRHLDTSDVEGNFSNESISATKMAGLLVMCSTGAWGRDPHQLAQYAAIVYLQGAERICVGWPGTYNLSFGEGSGDVYGCLMTRAGKLYVRAVIPVPIREVGLPYYQVL